MSALKISFFVIIATLAVLQNAEAQTAQTGLPLTKLGERYYHFGKSNINWYNAELYCRSNGLALVSFETQAEMDLVAAEIVNQGLGNSYGVWASGSDLGTEGQWSWTQTGKAMTFTAWATGEPNNLGSGENCLSLKNYGGTIKWNDDSCKHENAMAYVCELPTDCWGYN